MEFFDKIGKKASEAYKITADKTGKIAKETKNKLKMGELKSQINELYEQIGKKIYEKHVQNENIDINKDLEEECTKIDVITDEIDSLLKECLELKDQKQCPKCFTKIDKDVKFCPNCGEKQVEEPAKEAEVIETETVQENNSSEDNETKNNETQTEEVNNIESEENNNNEQINTEQDKTYAENLEKTVEVESKANNDNE